LLELGQKPATQLALELGIQRNQLYKWQAQLRARGALRGPGRPRREEESEVSRLKRELKRVTEERDILKKATAYFASRRG
jgi:transposase